MKNINKQGFSNLVIVYFGLLLGFFNTLFRTKVITTEQIGLMSFITSLAGMLSYFMILGIPSIILKYYSEIKENNNLASGFLLLFSTIPLILFIIITLFFFYSNNIL